MDPMPAVEVLGEEPSEPVTDRIWRSLRAHPVVPAILTAVALAGGGVLAVVATRPPEIPEVRVLARQSEDQATWLTPPWEDAADGRPSGPPVLAARVAVERAVPGSQPDVVASVVGLVGPGIVRTDNEPVVVPGALPYLVTLRAVLDCSRLPTTTSAGAYRVAMVARSNRPGSRTARGYAEIGMALGQRWADQIQLACGTWAARRHLTVTSLTATADPTRPRVAVRMTVTNDGAKEAVLQAPWAARPDVRVDSGLPIRIPARGSTEAEVSVVLDRCDNINPFPDGSSALVQQVALTSVISVEGRVGAIPEPSRLGGAWRPGALGSRNSVRSTGVLLSPQAAGALTVALTEACGGLRPIVVSLEPGSVRRDPNSGVVTVRAKIPTPPGRVRSLRLSTPAPDERPTASAYRPLWQPTGRLRPDPAGTFTVDLPYAPPGEGGCPDDGGYLPSLVVELEVPTTSGVRTLTYTGFADLTQDTAIRPILCGRP